MSDAPDRPNRLSTRLVLLLAAAWIATGALFKLLRGSPNDLPPVLHDLGIDMSLLYPTVIGIELAVAAFAVLAPRIGWWLVVLQLMAFLGVLGVLIQRGAESCGCFGTTVKISPEVMAGIDGALLLLLVFTRPWSGFSRRGLPQVIGGFAAGALLVLPFTMSREQTEPKGEVARPTPSGYVPPTEPREPGAEPATNVELAEAALEGTETRSTEPAPNETTEPEVVPATNGGSAKGWVVLPLETWEGKALAETELGSWVALDAMPQDGLWVFYRMTCDHCAEHLNQLWSTEVGQRQVALVRIVDRDEDENAHVVQLMPEGPHVVHLTLPEEVDWVLETPSELELAGGYVTRAEVLAE